MGPIVGRTPLVGRALTLGLVAAAASRHSMPDVHFNG